MFLFIIKVIFSVRALEGARETRTVFKLLLFDSPFDISDNN
jgi:hypothetical protein